MIPLDNIKNAVLWAPVSTSSAATVSGYVDTLGYEVALIDVQLDATGTANPITLNLSEGPAATGAWTTVAVGDTSYTIPSVETVLSTIGFVVDLKHRKRFLQVELTPGDDLVLNSCAAKLGLPKEAPITDAAMGYSEVVRV